MFTFPRNLSWHLHEIQLLLFLQRITPSGIQANTFIFYFSFGIWMPGCVCKIWRLLGQDWPFVNQATDWPSILFSSMRISYFFSSSVLLLWIEVQENLFTYPST